ncbi:MAG TPA: N-acetylmuramoyl-L-alanine amidase [Rhodospirillales bacterium]
MKAGIVHRPSPNFDDRPEGAPIDMLVLHYTGMETAAAAFRRLCDPAAKVSAHYVIDETGAVTAMVPEEKRAWHAGLSFWRGERDVNGRSIGIELVNPGHEFGYRDFPEVQMAALRDLAAAIVERHAIPARNVVGHSDVAPARKTDPGERFDWAGLAAAGIGLWPKDAAPIGKADDAADMLARYGYDIGDPAAAVAAFQRHFRPARMDGVADAETTGRLKALLDLCRP